jgi:hypothetical protein
VTHYELLGEICELYAGSDYFCKSKIFCFKNVLIPALKYDRYFIWREESGRLTGFCAYAFLSQEEIDDDIFNGEEVFQRTGSGIPHFCHFVCETGAKDVRRFISHIRGELSRIYPEDIYASGTRVYPSGKTRPERWIRKISHGPI